MEQMDRIVGEGEAPGTSSDAGVEATRRLPTPALGPLWVGPRALHAHVGTCGPPRARRVPISPLSWEFLLKAKQTKKVQVLPKFLAAAKWVSSQLPGGLWFWRTSPPAQALVGAPPWTSGTTLASPSTPQVRAPV